MQALYYSKISNFPLLLLMELYANSNDLRNQRLKKSTIKKNVLTLHIMESFFFTTRVLLFLVSLSLSLSVARFHGFILDCMNNYIDL